MEARIDPSQLQPLKVLLGDLNGASAIIEQGMAYATEIAIDSEELGLSEQVKEQESAVMNYLDMLYILDLQKAVLQDIIDQLQSEDAVSNPEVTYKERVAQGKQEYETMTEAQKYHQNDLYVDFKQKIWEKTHPGEVMPPLDPNEEDDIMIGARQVQLRCPLTMDLFEEPVTSKVCKHSFSKKAILQLIQRSPFKSIDCPIAGCPQTIKESDLVPNPTLERMVRRSRVARHDDDDDETQYHRIE